MFAGHYVQDHMISLLQVKIQKHAQMKKETLKLVLTANKLETNKKQTYFIFCEYYVLCT